MEWFKASHVDKKEIYKNKNFKNLISSFVDFFSTRQHENYVSDGITFTFGHQLKSKLYSHEDNKFFYLMKKFQKVS